MNSLDLGCESPVAGRPVLPPAPSSCGGGLWVSVIVNTGSLCTIYLICPGPAPACLTPEHSGGSLRAADPDTRYPLEWVTPETLIRSRGTAMGPRPLEGPAAAQYVLGQSCF